MPHLRAGSNETEARTAQDFRTENLVDAFVQFRERYDRFLEDYMAFLKALDRKLPDPIEPRPFGYYFNRPKPLALDKIWP